MMKMAKWRPEGVEALQQTQAQIRNEIEAATARLTEVEAAIARLWTARTNEITVTLENVKAAFNADDVVWELTNSGLQVDVFTQLKQTEAVVVDFVTCQVACFERPAFQRAGDEMAVPESAEHVIIKATGWKIMSAHGGRYSFRVWMLPE